MKIGYCGRACLQKRPDIFVEVCRLVSKAIPAAEFIWIGDGELRHLLVEAGVTVTGWLTNPETEVAKLDVLLCTAGYEGLSYSLVEAMALGVPCVISDVVGNRDLVRHGVTGYLASLDRVEDFANRVVEIASNQTLRNSFSEKAREFVLKNYSVEAMVEQTHDAYSRVLGRTGEKGTRR